MRPKPFLFLVPALITGSALAQQPLTTVRVASGLSSPLYAISPPGRPTDLFILEQTTGDIEILDTTTSTLVGKFLDLTGTILTGSERGLLGLAFHPDYDSNGRFFVNYTRSPDGDTMVVEYARSVGNPDLANTTPVATIIGPINQPQSNHNGGCVAFGPDGMLYISTGDGGNFNDSGSQHVAGGNSQADGSLLGKMLRLDVDIPFPHIPADNPFVGAGNPLDEIWAKGLRNPWRFSFDRETGDLWIGDVGQDSFNAVGLEEIDFQPASSTGGENYGWRCMEGFSCTGLSGCTCMAGSLTDPIHDYTQNFGQCAVTGGFVYRGAAMPDLHGTYFFADFCAGRIWSLEYDGVAVSNFTNRTVELAPGGGMSIDSIPSFGQDGNGEIYVCDFGGGEIYRIEPASGESFLTYCTGKLNSVGCVPFVSANGTASATSTNSFMIRAEDLVPNQAGLMIYGTRGRSGLGFHGGTLCVKSPLVRALPAKNAGTGGAMPCTGLIKSNFNNRIQTGNDPMLIPGQQVNAMFIQRDPSNTIGGFGDTLTNGIEFIIAN